MQKFKDRFKEPDGKVNGSVQTCIRTNDLDLIGDGSHLSSFEMVGNFSFGGLPYEHSINLWHSILVDLGWQEKVIIHVHPSRADHKTIWEKLNYKIQDDEECQWTDGEIGGNCCEVYLDGLEIGNLVNPLGHSTDVGFGYERMVQVFEGKKRVDETSLFYEEFHPVIRDHYRTLVIMKKNGILPGNKGREYVCRRLLRRCLRISTFLPGLTDWVIQEQTMLEQRLETAKKLWKKHKYKPSDFWWETCGLLPFEVDLIGDKNVVSK
jgi:alanyl-tRNA synthetase